MSDFRRKEYLRAVWFWGILAPLTFAGVAASVIVALFMLTGVATGIQFFIDEFIVR